MSTNRSRTRRPWPRKRRAGGKLLKIPGSKLSYLVLMHKPSRTARIQRVSVTVFAIALAFVGKQLFAENLEQRASQHRLAPIANTNDAGNPRQIELGRLLSNDPRHQAMPHQAAPLATTPKERGPTACRFRRAIPVRRPTVSFTACLIRSPTATGSSSAWAASAKRASRRTRPTSRACRLPRGVSRNNFVADVPAFVSTVDALISFARWHRVSHPASW